MLMTENRRIKGEFIEMYMQMSQSYVTTDFHYCVWINIGIRSRNNGKFSFSGGVFNPYGISASNIDITLPIPFSFCLNDGNILPHFYLQILRMFI